MNSLISLVRFSSGKSHSILVDFQQKYLRNLLLFGTGLSTVRLLFGVTIACQGIPPSSLNYNFLETKCYINGTVTDDLHHDYYQFTSVFLFVSAFAVQIPFWIWGHFTGPEVRQLEALANEPELAIRAVRDSRNLYLKTVALEGFYTVYWIALVASTDVFFNGYWSRFNWSWRVVPKLFPDSGTCCFKYYHASGESTASFNCLLPLSSVYRKVFSVLYWILAFLLPYHLVVLIYRAALFTRYPRTELERKWIVEILKKSTVSWSVRKKLEMNMNNNIV